MTEKSIVSCQIPQDWKVKIEHLAAERKKEPSQIIYEALAQYLGEDVNRNDSRLNALEAEVTALRGSISQLELIVKELQQRSHLVSTWSNSSAASVQPFTDEEFIEEEPDEISIDFLPLEER
jgi:predicted transcriptional regulator